MCIGLRGGARRRDRTRQQRQEQDVIIKGLDQEVEAQMRREDNVVINSNSELSQLRSNDFEGIKLQGML